MVLGVARAQAQKRAAHLVHPLLCLDAIEHGVAHGGYAGLQKVRACPVSCMIYRACNCWEVSYKQLTMPSRAGMYCNV